MAFDSPLMPADLDGRRVAVVGLAREGRAVTRMVRRDVPGAAVVGIDQSESEAAQEWAAEFSLPVVVSSDGHGLPDDIDVAVLSPGIAPHNPVYQVLEQRGVVLTSGSALFLAQHGHKVLAVTGSKGKSTTSALVHHLLLAHGVDAVYGGNVGTPLWDLEDAAWVVAEISSYQCRLLQHSPAIAVLTALFEEHLDWHGDFDTYARDKLNLVGHGPGTVVVNGMQQRLMEELEARFPNLSSQVVDATSEWSVVDDDEGMAISRNGKVFVPMSDLTVTGGHNAWNVALALTAATQVVALDESTTRHALRTFQPLPHRMQVIDDDSGVVFINDSLATNPPALVACLQAFRDKRLMVVIGGHDRGVNDSMLRDEILAHPVAAVIGLPDSGAAWVERIRSWCEDAGVEPPALHAVDDMDQALAIARRDAKPGDVVALSPGAPSFGRYRNYEQRADDFLRAIRGSAR